MKKKIAVIITLAGVGVLAGQNPVLNGSRSVTGTFDFAKAASFKMVTGNGAPASANCNNAKAITSSTNATPIVVTSTSHGFVSGEVVTIYAHATNTAANGSWFVGATTANTFALCGYWDGTTCQSPSVGNGVGGATGYTSNQVGRIYFRNDTTNGQNLYYCVDNPGGAPGWTQQLNSGAGGANTALSNLAAVAINTALLPGSAGTIDLGSSTLPFRNAYLAGSSGTPATQNFQITGTATGLRTFTMPDANSNPVIPDTGAANNFMTGITSGGVITKAQPTFSNISGIATPAQLSQTVNAQTGTTYTVVDGDRARLVTHSNASAVAVTLPQAGASSQFISGWFYDTENRGAGTVTITPTTSTIDSAASLALTQNQGVRIFSDGTNYFTQRGIGGAGGGGTTVQINGSALAASTGNFNDTTPAIPAGKAQAGGKLVLWQKDAASPTAISAYLLGQVNRPFSQRRFAYMTGSANTSSDTMLGDGLSNSGTIGAWTLPDASIPSQYQLIDTGATINTVAARNGGKQWKRNTSSPYSNLHFEARILLTDQASASQRFVAGFTDAALATQLGSDAPASQNYAAFLFNPATNSGQWVCITNAGGTATSTNSTTATDTSQHLLQIDMDDVNGHIYFTVDSTQICDVTATLPATGTYMYAFNGIQNLVAASRKFRSSGIYVESNQ